VNTSVLKFNISTIHVCTILHTYVICKLMELLRILNRVVLYSEINFKESLGQLNLLRLHVKA
jgi:hypothetical protein